MSARAREHQVGEVFLGVVGKAAHGAIGHLVFDKGDGAHVQLDQFGNIVELGARGETSCGGR